jgi:hypothetical protein
VTDYRTWGDKLGHSLFHWTASVAEFRGAEIYLRNPREAELLGFMVLGRNTIVINFGKLMGDTGRSFHQSHGAEAGADSALSEWMIAWAMLLHEWGHWELHRAIDGNRYESDPDYKAVIEAEANAFRLRFSEEVATVGTSVLEMPEEDGAALAERIRDEILAERTESTKALLGGLPEDP